MKITPVSAITGVIAAAEGLIARAVELRLLSSSDAQHAVLRVQKIHARAHVELALKHNLREDYATNADPEAGGIEIIAGARTVERGLARFDDIHERVNDGEPVIAVKNGKDPVLALELVLDGPSTEVWGTWDDEKQAAWKRAQVEWLRRYFPSESMVSCVVHLDESRVHATAILVPLAKLATRKARDEARKAGREIGDDDKRWHLSAKAFVGTHRLHFRARQTEYAEAMGEFGLIRGRFVEETKAIHVPNKTYRAKVAELCAGLELVMGDLLAVFRAQVEATMEAEKIKREAEALREQLTVAMRSESEAIELMHVQARKQMELERAEAKAEAKREADAIAVERAKLEADRQVAEATMRSAAGVERDKAENERRTRELADLEQRLAHDRALLDDGKRELTAAQVKLAADQKAAAEIIAKAAEVDGREKHVAAKEVELKARIDGFNAGLRALKDGRRKLAEGKTRLEDERAKAERVLRAAVAREAEWREAATAYRNALNQLPHAYRAAVQRETGRGLERYAS